MGIQIFLYQGLAGLQHPRRLELKAELRWLIGTKHFHRGKTLPQITKHFYKSKHFHKSKCFHKSKHFHKSQNTYSRVALGLATKALRPGYKGQFARRGSSKVSMCCIVYFNAVTRSDMRVLLPVHHCGHLKYFC